MRSRFRNETDPRRTLLRLETLEDRLTPSWSSVPPSTLPVPTNAVAVTLDNAGDATGTTSIVASEIDWFKFTAPRTGTYFFSTETPASYLDTVIGVYSATGVRLVYNDDISATNSDSATSTTLTAGQVYYFGVTNYNSTPGGAYNWLIDGPAAGSTTNDDVYEENDTLGTAYNLGSIGTPRTVTGLKMADTADWFKFNYTAGSSINTVSINFTHTQGDLNLRLFNSAGTQIAASAGTTNVETISMSTLASGTYFVQIAGANGAFNPNYSLSFTLVPPPPPPPPPTPANAWTVFVYMTSSSLYNYAFADINEMEKAVAFLPSTVKIVVLWDQSAAYPSYATGNGTQSPWTTTGRAVITGDTNMSRVATPFEILPEQNTGNPATLVNFLKWGVSVAPAQKYSLILWNHGAGLYGSNFDDSDNAPFDYLTISETVAALNTPGVPRINTLSYDACMMGMAEVGQAFKNLVDVFAASEELEAASGHDYSTLFNVLRNNPVAVTPEQLGAAYVTSFSNQYVGLGLNYDTYSAVRSTGYTGIETALRAFTGAAQTATTTTRTALQAARNNAVQYDGTYYVDYRDLGSFMRNVSNNTTVPTNIRTAASGVLTAVSSAVISRTSDRRGSSGIAIYLPRTTYDTLYTTLFPAFEAATSWGSFTRWLTNGSSSTSTTGWTSAGSGGRGPAERIGPGMGPLLFLAPDRAGILFAVPVVFLPIEEEAAPDHDVLAAVLLRPAPGMGQKPEPPTVAEFRPSLKETEGFIGNPFVDPM